MCSPIHGADIVGKTEQVIAKSIDTPLQGGFDLNVIAFAGNIDNLFVEGVFLPVHVFDVFPNAAFVIVGFDFRFVGSEQCQTAIAQSNFYPGIQIGQFSNPTGNGCILEFNPGRKYLNIGHKLHRSPGATFLFRGLHF